MLLWLLYNEVVLEGRERDRIKGSRGGENRESYLLRFFFFFFFFFKPLRTLSRAVDVELKQSIASRLNR